MNNRKRKLLIFISKTIIFIVIALVIWYASAPSLQIAESGAVVSEKTAESDNNVVSSAETKTVSSNITKTKKMTVVATAYCPCDKCSDGYGRATATGKTATAGRTIAVDPKIIPYGSKVTINGNTYIAEDCGGGIKGAKVDIFFDTHAETLKWGKRTVTAIIE